MSNNTTPNFLQVTIVSIAEQLYSGNASLVVAHAAHGEVGIMPRHTPFLAALLPGVVRVVDDQNAEHYFFVASGFIEVQPFAVVILADTAERAKDIDEAAALEAQKQALQLFEHRTGQVELAVLRSRLAEASARVKVLKRKHKGHY